MNTPESAGFPAVDVAGLRKTFGARVALAGLTLRLAPGRVFGAVGSNGGGKTTALRILAGLLAADAGRGQILGLDLRAQRGRLRHRVGYMTQQPSLYQELSVQENLLARARLFGVTHPRRRVEESLAEFGLRPFARERVGHLSGGWTRRVQFAATLVPKPKVLLLDEPTAGLDAETSRHLWEWTVDLAARGTTVVISTHDLTEASRCHAIGIFVGGTVVAQGSADAVVAGSGVRVFRIAASPVDPVAFSARLPGLICTRRGGLHHDLIFRGDVPLQTARLLQAAGFAPEAVPPTLEDAILAFARQTSTHERV